MTTEKTGLEAAYAALAEYGLLDGIDLRALAEAGRWTWADFRRAFTAHVAAALAGPVATAERATA